MLEKARAQMYAHVHHRAIGYMFYVLYMYMYVLGKSSPLIFLIIINWRQKHHAYTASFCGDI